MPSEALEMARRTGTAGAFSLGLHIHAGSAMQLDYTGRCSVVAVGMQ